MENFVKGSSVVAALPTLLYVGFYQMKNRNKMLNEATSPEIKAFLSIPFETIVVGILVAYGISYALMKESINEEEDSTMLRYTKVAIHGASLGLTLSLFGRFMFDLPVKMFGIPSNQAWTVHPTAILLYIAIFVYVNVAVF